MEDCLTSKHPGLQPTRDELVDYTARVKL
jgi:hypothetical protein